MEDEKICSNQDSLDVKELVSAQVLENNDDLSVDSSISSSSVPGEANILRSRKLAGTESSRELSETPPASFPATPTRSFTNDPKHKKDDIKNLGKPPRTFAELSIDYENKENAKALGMKGDMKSIDDYAYRGSKATSRIKSNIADRCLKLVSKVSRHKLSISIFLSFAVVGWLVMAFSKEIEQDNQLTEKFSWDKAQSSLKRDLARLKEHFPSQNRETIIHFLSAINSTLSKETPKQPSAITILTPPSMQGSTFPSCFILKIASIVNRLFSKTLKLTASPVKILDKDYFDKNGGNITGIHEDLKSYLKGGGKAVVVHNVEQLVTENHLLVFHSFCDNFKAEDKRATFFFIVPVPQLIHQNYQRHSWDPMFAAEISNDVLDQAWLHAISDDSRPAMISRIAATVVLLKQGDSCY